MVAALDGRELRFEPEFSHRLARPRVNPHRLGKPIALRPA
jgi:hypothetical protein